MKDKKNTENKRNLESNREKAPKVSLFDKKLAALVGAFALTTVALVYVSCGGI